MLVITRRHDEELLIGPDVRVRVLSIRGNRVQLGIDAPLDVRVQRPEVHNNLSWTDESQPRLQPPSARAEASCTRPGVHAG